jgi:hypothetical protein
LPLTLSLSPEGRGEICQVPPQRGEEEIFLSLHEGVTPNKSAKKRKSEENSMFHDHERYQGALLNVTLADVY